MKQHEQEKMLTILHRCLPDLDGIIPTDICPISGGGNNRLFKVTAAGVSIVLKRYFRHPADLRNRLDSEFCFSNFLWQRGVRCIPEPLGRDDETGTGLYRYVEGATIAPAGITGHYVNDALSFLSQANEWRHHAEALTLPDASEACFTLRQHLDLVERRIERLLDISQDDGVHAEAASFVSQRLLLAWDSVRDQFLRRVGETNQVLEEPLAIADRILSPSDFGFHNTLQTAQGLIFYDFEYAGWDDPAKMVCDFFCQIAIPVPMCYWDAVRRACAKLTISPEKILLRMELLLPLYRVKWVCIALNHFLKVDGERRRFAKGSEQMHLTTQLGLAEELLSAIQY